MTTAFKCDFVLTRVPPLATLSVSSLRTCELFVNEQRIGTLPHEADRWKQPETFEISPRLQVGTNHIIANVTNTNGPPALSLALKTPGFSLSTGPDWLASYAGAAWRTARSAASNSANALPDVLPRDERPSVALLARWSTLALFALLSTAGYWLATNKCKNWWARFAPGSELAIVIGLACFWVVLFVNNLGSFRFGAGFDLEGHLSYLRYIQEHSSLPAPGAGWETFQPPLYYILSAGLLGVFSVSTTQPAGTALLRLLGLVIGVIHFALVWASLRLLFQNERSKPRFGLVLAACLPPMLYLSHYITNEALGGMLASASIFLALRILKRRENSWWSWCGLGLCLGAALLTKLTSLLTLPPIIAALVWKQVKSPRTGPKTLDRQGQSDALRLWFTRVCVMLAICLAVCGWHYGRVWAESGNPMMGAWIPAKGFAWWQDDGYRTIGYYLRFGSVFTSPWFSSLSSFADGIYSTLWGDGLFGGAEDASSRPPWDYQLMSLSYWLAVVPALSVLLGAFSSIVAFIRKPSAEWFMMLALCFLIAIALLHRSLAAPYYCMVKAFYGLSALVPFCAFGATGLDRLWRTARKLRPVLCILFCTWAMTSIAAFWIPHSGTPALIARAISSFREGRHQEAVALLAARLEAEPHNIRLRSLLADISAALGKDKEAAEHASIAVTLEPTDANSQLVLAVALAHLKQIEPALEHVRRATELAPRSAPAWLELASLLTQQRRFDEAISASREGLAVAPFNSGLRALLGSAVVAIGDPAGGIHHLELACAIDPNSADAAYELASAYSGAGRYDGALQVSQKAQKLAISAGRTELAEKIRTLMESLARRKP